MSACLTISVLLSDIATAWTLNASLTISSSFRKCSKRRILGHSAQATSRLLIESTMKCSRTALGSGCGSSTGFAAEVKPKARIAFRASRFPRFKPIVTLNFRGLTDGCCGLQVAYPLDALQIKDARSEVDAPGYRPCERVPEYRP